MKQRDHLGMQEDTHTRSGEHDRIRVAAHRLTIYFTDEDDLPVQYRKISSSAKVRKTKEDKETGLEKQFKANVELWTQLIETMLSKISKQQAWRFIDLSPEISPTARKLTDCKDFCDLVDYLSLRRDKESCSADELGRLTWLAAAVPT